MGPASEKSLIKSIEEAFADAEYPGHRLEDIAPRAYGSDAELLCAFAGKHWRNLSAKFLERHRTFEFCFLTPTAFRFYLPAYLIGSIRHPIRSKAWTDMVIYHLSPPKASGYRDEDALKFWNERIHGLSPEQKYAIRLWFEYLVERETFKPELELADYWKLQSSL